MSDKFGDTELGQLLGIGFVILCILFGLGGCWCLYGLGMNQASPSKQIEKSTE